MSQLVSVQFNHWEKLQDNGDKIVVESPPIGIEPLPTDSRHVGEIDSAFVYSYDWGVLQQKVNLKDVGLTKEILRTMMPFQFVATQVYVWSIDVSFPFISKSN